MVRVKVVVTAFLIMGCIAPRSSAEESTIESRSVATGFERHSVDMVVGAIRSHSTAKLILPAQFEAIKKTLKLNAEEKDQAVLKEFYKRFVTPNAEATEQIEAVHSRVDLAHLDKTALLEEERLLAAAILLSSGASRDKALALYRLFDEGFSNALTESILTELLRTIFKLASEDLISLAKLTEGDEVKKYITKTQQNFDKAVAAALALFKKELLTPEAFATTLIAYKNGQLTSPSGLREFMVDQTPKPPAEKLVAGPVGAKATSSGEKPAKPEEEAKVKEVKSGEAPHEEAKKPSA